MSSIMEAGTRVQFQQAVTPDDLARFSQQVVGAQLSESFVHEHADAHWMALDGDGLLVARCSLWWRRVPKHHDDRLGLIGHFAAASFNAGVAILRHACGELTAKRCTLAVGPMDGSTWRPYRLVTERGSEPAFFMEPDNPDEWVTCFQRAGLNTFAVYFSALCPDLSKCGAAPEAAERVRDLGIHVRTLRMEQVEQELRRLYPLTRAFSNNFLFTPLSESEFIALYMPVARYIRPELVFIAEVREAPVGFLFCVPDLLQAPRGAVVDTVIAKTLAIVPQYERIGLGGLLVARANQAAGALGYRRMIYALMHEHNLSRNITRRYGDVMRRYELFARKLEGVNECY